ELRRVPHVRPDAGLAVRREEDRGDRPSGARAARRNFLPQLPLTRVRVEPVDACRHDALAGAQLVGAAHVEPPVAGNGPDRLLARERTDARRRLSLSIGGIEAPDEIGAAGTEEARVPRQDGAARILGRDGPRRTAAELLYPDAPRPFRLVSRVVDALSVREES